MAFSQRYANKRLAEAALCAVALHGATYPLLPGHHPDARGTRIARYHDNDHPAVTKTSSRAKDPLKGRSTTKRSVRPAARRRYAADLWHADASEWPVQNESASGCESHASSCVAEHWADRYVSSGPRFRKIERNEKVTAGLTVVKGDPHPSACFGSFRGQPSSRSLAIPRRLFLKREKLFSSSLEAGRGSRLHLRTAKTKPKLGKPYPSVCRKSLEASISRSCGRLGEVIYSLTVGPPRSGSTSPGTIRL